MFVLNFMCLKIERKNLSYYVVGVFDICEQQKYKTRSTMRKKTWWKSKW